MKYTGMPAGMWLLFAKSFENRLITVFGYAEAEAHNTALQAETKYKEIISSLPVFEKEDRFMMNIVSCAMLTAFLLSMKKKTDVYLASKYYRDSMMTVPMKLFCRLSGKRKFTDSDIEGLRKTEKLKAADRNPYSWNMEFYEYEDGSGYEARFTKCGICTLMKQYGLSDLIPAMCRLDYTMSHAGGASVFKREYTLAQGGPYCDCGYFKKSR